MDFVGTGGNDSLTGTESDDDFDMRQGGRDEVFGLGGNDLIRFGDRLTGHDAIDGGAGTDTLVLRGDYSAGLLVTAAIMQDVEVVVLWGAFDYAFSIADGVVDGTLTVDASTVTGSVTVDGRATLGGSFSFGDGAAGDTFIGGEQGDTFNLTHGGNEDARGRGGADIFHLAGTFTRKDSIDGGGGEDALTLVGDYSAGVVFRDTTLTGIETIFLTSGFSYAFTLTDTTVAAGSTLIVEGLTLGPGRSLMLDGSLETDGAFDIRSGSGDDVIACGAGDDVVVASGGNDAIDGGGGGDDLSGGAGNDELAGGLGGDILFGAGGLDRLSGGEGADILKYFIVSDSTGAAYDTVAGFDTAEDRFDLAAPVTGINAAIDDGTLSTATFDFDLAAAADGHLKVNRAVLFTPDAGDLAGATFLIIDRNGFAGYQAGADFVIEIESGIALASLSTANFI